MIYNGSLGFSKILVNNVDLKTKLENYGINFYGSTDTEVIANLIEDYLLYMNNDIKGRGVFKLTTTSLRWLPLSVIEFLCAYYILSFKWCSVRTVRGIISDFMNTYRLYVTLLTLINYMWLMNTHKLNVTLWTRKTICDFMNTYELYVTLWKRI